MSAVSVSEEFERALAYLKQTNTNGQTLYDHIVQLILSIQNTKNASMNKVDLFDQLEKLSAQIKKNYTVPDVKKEIPANVKLSEAKQLLDKFITQQSKLLNDSLSENNNNNNNNTDYHVPTQTQPKSARIEDVQENLNLIRNHAGISPLTEQESYKLQYKLYQLTKFHQLDNARFWGKIIGRERDYYIAEVKINRKNIPSPLQINNTTNNNNNNNDSRPSTAIRQQSNKKLEKLGIGLNEYVYYVCNSLDGSWIKLPLIEPELIILSRQIHKFFTGRLNAIVTGFPRFPYSEAYYLRAQIARISANTHIAPKGYYTVETIEDEANESTYEVINKDNEFEGLGNEELLGVENWAHEKRHVLKQGRIEPYQAPEVEETDEQQNDNNNDEKTNEEEVEPEEALPSLSGLESDELAPELGYKLTSPWSIKPSNTSNPNHPHSAAIVKSLLWPGAVAVAKGKQCVNIYVGYGTKYLPKNFTPIQPPVVLSEYVSTFNPEEEEVDPLHEQSDPLPPAVLPRRDEHDDEDNENGDENDENEDENDEDLGSDEEDDQ